MLFVFGGQNQLSPNQVDNQKVACGQQVANGWCTPSRDQPSSNPAMSSKNPIMSTYISGDPEEFDFPFGFPNQPQNEHTHNTWLNRPKGETNGWWGRAQAMLGACYIPQWLVSIEIPFKPPKRAPSLKTDTHAHTHPQTPFSWAYIRRLKPHHSGDWLDWFQHTNRLPGTSSWPVASPVWRPMRTSTATWCCWRAGWPPAAGASIQDALGSTFGTGNVLYGNADCHGTF